MSVIPERMPAEVADRLGYYVYGLRDPRNGHVFYVGMGKGERIFHHVWAVGAGVSDDRAREATLEKFPEDQKSVSAKNRRISSILESGASVEHIVFRHQIKSFLDESGKSAALAIEQVLIDAFRMDSRTDDLSNIAGGHTETELRAQPIGELIAQYSAEPAAPLPTPCAVVVINRAYEPGMSDDEVYEACRKWWRVGQQWRDMSGLPILAVARGVIRGVFEAESWSPLIGENGKEDRKLWSFAGTPSVEYHDFIGKSLTPRAATGRYDKWRQHGWHPISSGGVIVEDSADADH